MAKEKTEDIGGIVETTLTQRSCSPHELSSYARTLVALQGLEQPSVHYNVGHARDAICKLIETRVKQAQGDEFPTEEEG